MNLLHARQRIQSTESQQRLSRTARHKFQKCPLPLRGHLLQYLPEPRHDRLGRMIPPRILSDALQSVHVDTADRIIAADETLQFSRIEESYPRGGDQVAKSAEEGTGLEGGGGVELGVSDEMNVADDVATGDGYGGTSGHQFNGPSTPGVVLEMEVETFHIVAVHSTQSGQMTMILRIQILQIIEGVPFAQELMEEGEAELRLDQDRFVHGLPEYSTEEFVVGEYAGCWTKGGIDLKGLDGRFDE
mmetsp:Transcript_114/g.199  ORF Transcript_114/g.199 Transcript_114/m.199 type:complete len:245 (-) Transcript_114:528-1262(-)